MPSKSEFPYLPPTEAELEKFWAIIGRTTAFCGSEDQQIKALEQELMLLSKEQLIGFQANYIRAVQRAQTQEVLDVAIMLNGQVSDDGFQYFTDWLISLGRKAYEAAIQNPDDLVPFLPDPADAPTGFEFELLAYVAGGVFEKKFGEEMPELDHSLLKSGLFLDLFDVPDEPLGDKYALLGDWVHVRDDEAVGRGGR